MSLSEIAALFIFKKKSSLKLVDITIVPSHGGL